MQLALDPHSRARRAATAVRTLLRDPNDTSQVFRLIEALSGPTPRHLHGRFSRSPEGARLLAERPRLLSRLADRDALAALPAASLGRAYLAFMERGKLSADGLVAASEAVPRPSADADEAAWIGDRLRDSHDLWHVVTGYRDDIIGEAALLAFSYAQTRTRGVGVLAAVALVRVGDNRHRRLIVEGLLRGRRAAWLPAVPWEALLAEDLEAVRARLRVGPPPVYTPVWAHELDGSGRWIAPAA